MTSASKFTTNTAGAVEINGFGASYGYDQIGNRLPSTGMSFGTPRLNTGYTTNALNQYVIISNPQIAPVRGLSYAAPYFMKADGAASLMQMSGFYSQSSNDSAKLENLVLSLGYTTSNTYSWPLPDGTGQLYVPPPTELLSYDADGNLTSDGRGTYQWDAENRLVAFYSNYGGLPSVTAYYRYDAKGRRIYKAVYSYPDTVNSKIVVDKFLWHGWQLARKATIVDSGNTPAGGVITTHTYSKTHQDYTWGLDVSGSIEGAGCVGGLVMMTAPLTTRTTSAQTDSYGSPYGAAAQTVGTTTYDTWFPTYDHNGNVNHLLRQPSLESTDSYGSPTPPAAQVDATYEYDAFGNILRSTGPAAAWNAFTFSTKYLDQETGWIYYGYRYYDALRGRWLSRDPIGEQGGVNLYANLKNDPLNDCDFLGLKSKRPCAEDFAKNYPSKKDVYDPNDVFKEIGGWMAESDYGSQGSCAARVSVGLNGCKDFKIPRTSKNGASRVGDGGKNPNDNIITSAGKMCDYLEATLGKPDYSGSPGQLESSLRSDRSCGCFGVITCHPAHTEFSSPQSDYGFMGGGELSKGAILVKAWKLPCCGEGKSN